MDISQSNTTLKIQVQQLNKRVDEFKKSILFSN